MTLTVPKHRALLDDTTSVKDPLALMLLKLVEPQYGATWDLIPFGENIRQLKYEVGSRSISGRTVVLENAILTGDTDIDLTSATKTRVTDGHILYHPATKQRFILDEHSTSTGTATIRAVQQADGGSRTQVNAGQTLYILAQSEHYEEINAESRFENTSSVDNYIQDLTERLEFSVADIREGRKFGVDKRMRMRERMRDIVQDLNLSMLFNVPLAASSGANSAVTAGFDYLIELGGNVVNAASSGTANLADPRGVLKQLQKNGVGPSDGLVAQMSINTYHAYSDAGLAELQVTQENGGDYILGNVLRGLNVPGIGFVPFYFDPFINDDRVRFIATAHASKHLYQGLGEEVVEEGLRVVDEPSLSTSKVEVSTMQMKWGTNIRNTDTAHYILDNTGLN